MENVPIGIAMIARNAEDLMPLALDPLKEHVDAIAIVLGGESDDGTAELAAEYATLPVEPFNGQLDDGGRLMSFAQARNQSFDILRRAGFEYALVVDTDDQWEGAEKIQQVLGQADVSRFPMVLFPYAYDGGTFMQPRIYRMDSGHWESPCHNFWEIDNGERVALQTDLMKVRQVREKSKGTERIEQNIHISKTWMEEHGDDCRLLQHMAKDLMVARRYDEAELALERYFAQYEKEDRQDPEEYYTAWHTMASIHISQNRFADALIEGLKALAVRGHAQTWTLAAEAASFMSRQSANEDALLRLSVFLADQALAVGKPRQNLHWHADRLSGSIPLLIKARSLLGLGRARDAIGALDLGLMLDPDDKDMKAMRQDVARQLGELA